VPERIVLPPGETAKKLENFLKKRFPIGYVRKLFRKNALRINGKRAQADDLVQPGDEIQLFIPFESGIARSKSGPSVELDIIFEDAGIVVINKPAGIAVHEGKNVLNRDSILGMLQAKYRGQPINPRLVHRLDRETSGVLLIAKDEATRRALEESFHNAAVEKEYICLVAGRVEQHQGKIDYPLPGRTGSEVPALTRFSVVKRFSDTTLLRVATATGRMHQIRLHFAKLGYPVVMDNQHGDFSFNKKFRKEYRLRRHFLHAARLSLVYDGKPKTWSAPVPADLRRVLKALDLSLARSA
jgi:23S rRNA pseudouridine955/2504/2580 synthase